VVLPQIELEKNAVEIIIYPIYLTSNKTRNNAFTQIVHGKMRRCKAKPAVRTADIKDAK
jgi:hypothetical protein